MQRWLHFTFSPSFEPTKDPVEPTKELQAIINHEQSWIVCCRGSLFDQVSTMKFSMKSPIWSPRCFLRNVSMHMGSHCLWNHHLPKHFSQVTEVQPAQCAVTAVIHIRHFPKPLPLIRRYGGESKRRWGKLLVVFLLMAKNRRFDYVRCLKPCKQRDI